MTNTIARTGLLLSFAAAATVGAALSMPASASAAGNAAATINALEASGFDVRVTRIGNGPLSECIVSDVGSPREQRRLTVVEGRDDDRALIPVVFKRSITVAVNCSA